MFNCFLSFLQILKHEKKSIKGIDVSPDFVINLCVHLNMKKNTLNIIWKYPTLKIKQQTKKNAQYSKKKN